MRFAAVVSCLALVGMAGCAGVSEIGFGPFPTSGIGGGQLTAGVAGFVPGTVPREGEFSLLVVNTDADTVHNVVVTPEGGLASTRSISPCSAASFAVPCDAPTVLVQVILPGVATRVELTITPVPDACRQRIVYIGAAVKPDGGGGGGTDEDDEPPTLSETIPASAVNCGLGGLPTGMADE
ncbi:MAG TPA: hypothetical protein PL151_12115 [Phycisphaerae bacterium]|nr:hypothetical protein [Phycisphaerae bacterium]HOJ73513.1 hypothetical protein [Phycisphaerae bacterium]HOM51679.1 hypothetical protein [Phycisphaerae bacterium]HON68329.1 hypothetical protein [Phycisphaerae bacterium]HOQ86276.1 hypothetical protein [Phycisphaerae bacterium]